MNNYFNRVYFQQVDQIMTEYKNRALILHPDKNDGDDESVEKFKLLQKAKNILTDPVMKKKYDNWLNSGLNVSFSKWIELNKSGQSFHWIKEPVTKPMIQSQDDGQTKEQVNKTPFKWESENRNDLVRKFRNYDI